MATTTAAASSSASSASDGLLSDAIPWEPDSSAQDKERRHQLAVLDEPRTSSNDDGRVLDCNDPGGTSPSSSTESTRPARRGQAKDELATLDELNARKENDPLLDGGGDHDRGSSGNLLNDVNDNDDDQDDGDGVESSASTILHNNLTASVARTRPEWDGPDGRRQRGGPAIPSHGTMRPDVDPGERTAEWAVSSPVDDLAEIDPSRLESSSLSSLSSLRSGHALSDATATGAGEPDLHISKLTSESIENHLLLQQTSYNYPGAVGQGMVTAIDGGGNVGSDVLSTASEMGTVIDAPHAAKERVMQLDDVLAHYQQQQQQEESEPQEIQEPHEEKPHRELKDRKQHVKPTHRPITPKSRNNYYEHMFDIDDDDESTLTEPRSNKDSRDDVGGARNAVPGLALPRLDGTYHVDEKKVSETVSITAVHVGGIGGSNAALTNREGNVSGPAATANGGGNSHLAAGILSRTMKRFSSNLMPSSLSAPNTPRANYPRPPNSSRKSPMVGASSSAAAAATGDDMPPAAPSLRHSYKSPVPSFASSADDTPTSFLLRSPGSSARMAAKRQHRQHKQVLEEARSNDLLLPRFGSLRQRRQDTNEGSQVPPSPTGTQQRPPSAAPPTPSASNRKYSHVLARACFSFDAYDTCVDHLYEVPAVLMDPSLDQQHVDPFGGTGTSNHPWMSSPVPASSPIARNRYGRYPAIPERSWESSAASTPTPPSSSYASHLHSLSPLRADADRAQPLFRTSSSWDAGSSTTYSPLRHTWGRAATGAAARPLPEPFAFRPTKSTPTIQSFGHMDPSQRNHPVIHRHHRHFAGPMSERDGGANPGFAVSPPRAAVSSTPSRRPSSLRNGFMTSPHHPTPSRGQLDVLASPQRLEMEREDALDILACLVERGVTLKNVSDNVEASTAANVATTAPPNQEVSADKISRPSMELNDKPSPSSTADGQQNHIDLALVVESLVQISSQHPNDVGVDEVGDDSTQKPTAGITHEERVRVLEELVRSHEYALEMKRVSQSASSWLQSIGRNIGSAHVTSESATATSATPFKAQDKKQKEDELGDEEVDLLTAKAMLHSACVEIEERAQYAETLNLELAKCRAEIGRLKSAANTSINASFRSPNRSILDVSEELSPTSSIDRSFDNASPIPGKDEGQYLDSSFEDIVPLKQDKTDLAKFQAALEDANEMIRKLHGDLKLQAQGKLQDGAIEEDAPVIRLSDVAIAVSPSISKEELAVEHDPENFVTDWDELRPALPPPPDHELRSPIVESVLEGWSTDPTLRERLMGWMEQVLSGADPISIPPLTLSHLDHQVRDGFTTHVLPLLLRRPDIRVDVQTRAQRLTTYDLAISVERVLLSPQLLSHRSAVDARQHGIRSEANQSDAGTDFASHSTVTALVSNKHRHHPYQEPYPLTSTTSSRSAGSFFPDDPAHAGGTTSSRLSHDEMADGSVGPHHSHAGIMGALGDALGGLLSRRKGGPGAHDAPTPVSSSMPHARGEHPDFTPRNQGAGVPSSTATDPNPVVYIEDVQEDADDEPYHRVVAAPPGRLGVTFVEYRGHAMVSDVAHDKSPLTGWIFPGDILIAIDELSVSGMRLRDVIQVLKDRGNRQRALRVISSHDMTELHLGNNTSALLNDVS